MYDVKQIYFNDIYLRNVELLIRNSSSRYACVALIFDLNLMPLVAIRLRDESSMSE